VQAVHIPAHGPPSVLRLVDLPVPRPAAGEILVRVIAASVNHLDLFARAGIPGLKLPLPLIPGCDGTGEVVEIGPDVPRDLALAVGTQVLIEPGATSGKSEADRAGNDHYSDDYRIRGEHFDGLDREYVAIEARFLRRLPAGVDPVTIAATPLVFLTAWGMLAERAKPRRGETVLVLGGSSGVGSAAIQVARDLGARVIATASSDAKAQLCRELGAEDVVDHSQPDWGKLVRERSGGRGVDVVVEHVGPATWDTSTKLLARGGRLVTCGGTTGTAVSLSLPHLFFRQLSILGSTMGPRAAFPEILARLASGAYRPVVDRVLPLSRVAEAHELLESRAVLGKIVLTPGS
jgi:NADPH:quinone reductase-like Zn-dependent oxidoreductase